MRLASRAIKAAAAFFLSAASATACPFCESAIGAQVRAGIFNEQFWGNALLTLAPFPILLAIVGLLYFGPPRPLKKSETTRDDQNRAPASLP